MKNKPLLLVLAILFMYSCSGPLDEKTYTVGGFEKDLEEFKAKKVDPIDLRIIQYYVNTYFPDTNLFIAKTYADLLDEGEKLRDSLVIGYEQAYTSLRDSSDIIELVSVSNKILYLQPDNEFIESEREFLEKAKQEQIDLLTQQLKDLPKKYITKRIGLATDLITLDKTNRFAFEELVSSLAKKEKYEQAKDVIINAFENEVLTEAEYNNYLELLMLKRNKYSLIKLTRGGLSSERINESYSISDLWNASGPSRWNNSTNVTGYITNISKTLNISGKIKVRFEVRTTTRVTLLFVTNNKVRTDYYTDVITVRSLEPGKQKSFSTSIKTQDENIKGIGNSRQEITDVDIWFEVSSPKL